MTRSEFLHLMDRIAPGHGLGPDDALATLPPYPRLAIARWLADALEQPTDLEVVLALPTLAAAWAWLEESVRSGEHLRSSDRSTPGATTRVRLRPLLDHDLPALYLASVDPHTANTWRYRGRTVPVEEFLGGLHDGVRAQYVVELVETGIAVGLVAAYDHQQAGRHCKLACIRFGSRSPGDRGAVLEGLVALMSHLFLSHPYRKLYIELPAYNARLLEAEIFVVEGTLREHLFHDGRYVDLHIASLSRDRWKELRLATGW